MTFNFILNFQYYCVVSTDVLCFCSDNTITNRLFPNKFRNVWDLHMRMQLSIINSLGEFTNYSRVNISNPARVTHIYFIYYRSA